MRYLPLALLATLSAGISAQNGDFRPLVLTGSDTPLLLGAPVTAPICYTFTGGTWTPCPLQIDERDFIDRGSAYPRSLYPEFYDVDAVYHYTAPQDYPNPRMTPTVPPDSDPTFDADDELVLMARFFGDPVDVQVSPPPFASDTVQEVLFEDRAVYLFVPTQAQDQSAGIDLVSYTFNLLRGNFPEDYDFSSNHFDQYHAAPNYHNEGDYLAANPEYSPVETTYYRTSFEDRWIQRELYFPDGAGGFGPDILDRMKYAGRPDYTGSRNGCGRTIWTGSAYRGTLGIQKDGPLRAIRYVQGYNSGGFNHVLYLMYEQYMELEMGHTMHETKGGSMWYDLAPAATGMTYYSNIYPSGVTVDGIPDYPTGDRDNIFPDEYIDWDYLIGNQGSMVGVWEAEHNLRDPLPRSYYEDDTTPDIQNCSGDRRAYGNFGNTYVEPFPNQDGMIMYSTDPREEEAYFPGGILRYLRLKRRAVPEVPNISLTEAAQIRDQLKTPLLFTVSDRPITGGADTSPPIIDGALDFEAQLYTGTAQDLGSGMASLTLTPGSNNLALDVDPFTPGAPSVNFTATPIDPGQPASGTLQASDVASNQATLFLNIEVPPQDELAPVFDGTVSGDVFNGSASDDRADDSGLQSIVLESGAINLTLSVDPFPPGAAAATFAVTLTDSAQPGSGTVVATDMASNSSSLPVSLEPVVVPDTSPPVLSGTVTGSTLSGSATDDGPNDSGVSSITLQSGATNLALSTDPFSPGDASTTFTVTLTDDSQPGSGTVIATDLAGNSGTLPVSLEPDPPTDSEAPLLIGSVEGSMFSGSATDDRPDDSGVQHIALQPGSTNLTLTADPFLPGAASVVYTVTLTNNAQPGSGHVIATDVAGNSSSLPVSLEPEPSMDTAPPVLAGSTEGITYTGSATDDRTNDSGIESVALEPGATNLTLSVDPFTEGAASVSFSVTLVDDAQSGSGTVVANDVAGNSSSLPVSLSPAPSDPYDLAGTGAYAFSSESNGTITITAHNLGTEALTSVRVVRKRTTSVSVSPRIINLGALAPGETRDATFSFTNAGPTAEARFEVQDQVVRRNESNLNNNLVVLTLTASGDITPPEVDGSVIGEGAAAYFAGTASETAPEDSGIASVTLEAGAENVILDVDPFVPGAATVSFTMTRTDPEANGSGIVIATDVAGNTTAYPVALGAPAPDTDAPILTGSYSARSFDGTAHDDRPTDTGLASITLRDAVNLRITVDGDLPGASIASYRVEPVVPSAGQGTIVAVDLVGNESTLFVSTSLSTQRDGTDGSALSATSDEASGINTGAAQKPFHDSEIARDGEISTDEGAGLAPPGTFESGTSTDNHVSLEDASDRLEQESVTTADGKPEVTHKELKPPHDAPESLTTTDAASKSDVLSSSDTAMGRTTTVTPLSSDPLPDSPLVVEVYPNPLRAAAMVRLYVSTESLVRVALYDLMGRCVAVVVDQSLGAGWHDVRLTTSELAGGVYIWRAETNARVESGRLSILH